MLSGEIALLFWSAAAFAAGAVLAFGIMASLMRRQSRQLTETVEEHTKVEAALRAKDAQFQAIMDHAPMMMSLRDSAGRFTFINKSYVKFAEQSEESIIGHTIAELRGKEFGEMVAAQDAEVLAKRRALQWELVLQKQDGPRTVQLTKFPVYDADGKASIASIVADITERKQSETRMAQAQRMEAVGQLTGGIAHDFNNLLTSIILNADVLSSALDDKLKPLAESVRTGAEHGADLTRRLLAFGRRQMLEPRPTDVRTMLDGMLPLLRRTLGEQIDIHMQHGAGLWAATVDPGQLENAVINLAFNARDAMPSGGRLTIETGNIEFDAEQATLYPEIKPGAFVMIAVGDNGCGMPSDVVARAFDPFFTTKDVGKGTGLGLSMVYGFVTQSGGHARIYSEVGHGTVVRLYLPRSVDAVRSRSVAPTSHVELPTGTETVLFVEDDAMVRQNTGRQIAALGYKVVTAENGPEALALVENGCTPDILFTDVVMPGGMNGRQLARRLRERWPDLPVLYTSGYSHGALTIDGEQVPAKVVLGKPYRRRDLAAKLRDTIDAPVAVH